MEQVLVFHSPFPDTVGFSCLHISSLAREGQPNRKDEFALGRLASKQALEEIGISKVEIGRGENGEPIWPGGVSGSISHDGDYAVAAVSKAHRAIGIDLIRTSRDISEKLKERISSPKELEWINSEHLKTLKVFSAKEACYKALFPLCNKHLGFSNVELTWQKDHFIAQMTRELELPNEFIVNSEIQEAYLLSSVCI